MYSYREMGSSRHSLLLGVLVMAAFSSIPMAMCARSVFFAVPNGRRDPLSKRLAQEAVNLHLGKVAKCCLLIAEYTKDVPRLYRLKVVYLDPVTKMLKVGATMIRMPEPPLRIPTMLKFIDRQNRGNAARSLWMDKPCYKTEL